jgi:hypothetical protein
VGQTGGLIEAFAGCSGDLACPIPGNVRRVTGQDSTKQAPGPVHQKPRDSIDEGNMQIVYAMDVIDTVAGGNGRYVRRFTYETREEAWSKYSEAITSAEDITPIGTARTM